MYYCESGNDVNDSGFSTPVHDKDLDTSLGLFWYIHPSLQAEETGSWFSQVSEVMDRSDTLPTQLRAIYGRGRNSSGHRETHKPSTEPKKEKNNIHGFHPKYVHVRHINDNKWVKIDHEDDEPVCIQGNHNLRWLEYSNHIIAMNSYVDKPGFPQMNPDGNLSSVPAKIKEQKTFAETNK